MSVLENFRWPSLARDLAVMQTPGSPLTDFGEIYDTYRITEDELKKVIQIPEFQQMYRNELEGFRAQGSRAASLYRAGTLSQALTEHLFSDAVAGKMKAPDMLKLLELLLKASGQLSPDVPAVSVQTNVGIAIPVPDLKNPKLNHLKAVEVHG